MARPDPALIPPRPPTLRERLVFWLSKVQFVTYTVLVLTLLALGFIWPRVFIIIAPGHRGVMYRIFHGGTVTDRFWGEGMHVIVPWDKLFSYETRLQQKELTFDALSDEGLTLGVSVSVRYRPDEEMLGFLHQDVGPEYFERLIKPEVEAHVRRTLGSRPAHEIYTSSRDILQELGQTPVLGRSTAEGGVSATRPYVNIQELKLIAVHLPQIVEASVAEKYRQEQLMLEYRYKLEREEKESERKRTEAAGIRDFNLIASRITPDLLRWRSIDATLELAKSPNSKVVVLGGGQNTPMIMNLENSPPAEAKAPAAPVAEMKAALSAEEVKAAAATPPPASPKVDPASSPPVPSDAKATAVASVPSPGQGPAAPLAPSDNKDAIRPAKRAFSSAR